MTPDEKEAAMLFAFTNPRTGEFHTFNTNSLTYDEFFNFFDFEIVTPWDEEEIKALYAALASHDHEAVERLLPATGMKPEWAIQGLF